MLILQKISRVPSLVFIKQVDPIESVLMSVIYVN